MAPMLPGGSPAVAAAADGRATAVADSARKRACSACSTWAAQGEHLDSSASRLRHENTRLHRGIPVDGPFHRSGKEEETSRAWGRFPARATARWAGTAHWDRKAAEP
eukprot:COSAG01_NODE_1079_length_11822_cov_4.368762_10_plen_107_part_00